MPLNRVAVGAAAATALAGAVLAVTPLAAYSAPLDPNTASLRQLAKPTGVRIGTAVNTSALTADDTPTGRSSGSSSPASRRRT